MKAVVYRKYGPPEVLRLEEVEKPVPQGDEVLVKVEAASVNPLDWHFMRGAPFFLRLAGFGVFKPKNQMLGADMAGRVEAVGGKATRFQPGDEVFGDMFLTGLGGFAEYARARETLVARKPPGITFEQAAAVPVAAVTALQGLRDKGKIQAGQEVLIHGASGGVGTFAVQIAKAFGARVTALCSTGKVETLRSIGADRVIDYTKEDFAAEGGVYDLIFAANGNRSIFAYRRALKPNGTYVCAGGSMGQMFRSILLGPVISMFGSRKMGMMGTVQPKGADLGFLAELLEAGKVVPVIDRRYPLAETAAAVRYVEEGHARGKVVITM